MIMDTQSCMMCVLCTRDKENDRNNFIEYWRIIKAGKELVLRVCWCSPQWSTHHNVTVSLGRTIQFVALAAVIKDKKKYGNGDLIFTVELEIDDKLMESVVGTTKVRVSVVEFLEFECFCFLLLNSQYKLPLTLLLTHMHIPQGIHLDRVKTIMSCFLLRYALAIEMT
ncbi:CLUMA_CG011808, isoform A [Clunio marinus]|uniref:CLUMA_CG011808, isoform A n=1 Tax=Clunio marinus TaxID=568069 RepID=A0A1J1IE20_9DIPT|nr:CLUMA_CG011808, isoform A [Clunio marinus]